MNYDWSGTDTEGAAVAVIGMACRFCGAGDLDAYWRLLDAEGEGLRPLSADELRVGAADVSAGRVPVYNHIDRSLEFDAEFFGLPPDEAALLDPQHRLLLQACWHALEDAGVRPDGSQDRIGVFAGVGFNTYLLSHVSGGLAGHSGTGLWRVGIANDKDTAPTRVAYKLGLRGPAIGVQTACSSSLVAVHLACQSLLCGESDIALAGGAAVHFPRLRGYVHSVGGVESHDGHCRPFVREATGTVFTDGVGVVVLRRLRDALSAGDRIYAVVLSSAVNNDGADKVGYTAPSVSGQVRVLRDALAAAGVTADEVGYVEAHGTGTSLGDAIELRALTEVFGERRAGAAPCRVGAVKGNIGHADVAAGIAGFIKAVLALERGRIPATLHARAGLSAFVPGDVLAPCEDACDWPRGKARRVAGVSSFGIGGTNAHVLLTEAPAADRAAPRPSAQAVVFLQAPTAGALERQHEQARSVLERAGPDAVHAVAAAYAARPRRGTMRRALLVGGWPTADVPELICDGSVAPASEIAAAWLIPGQGSQQGSMAANLYATSAAFRHKLEEVLEQMTPEEALRCRSLLLHADDANADLDATENTHLVLFALCSALARQQLALGLEPRAILGHSLGEVVGAAIAGVWSPADALAVVRRRGQLLSATPQAAMAAVRADLDSAALAAALPPGVTIGCFNGPGRYVLCGPAYLITQLARSRSEWHVRLLRSQRAFHSPAVESAVAPFRDFLLTLRMQAPRWPLLSGATGQWLTAEDACSADYWARQLREPVHFGNAVRSLLARGAGACLELGPGRTLATLVSLQQPRLPVVCALEPTPQGVDASTALLARLWVAGVKVDERRVAGADARSTASVPGYVFAPVHHELQPPAPRPSAGSEPPRGPASAELLRLAWRADPRLEVPNAQAARWLVVADEPLPPGLVEALPGVVQTWFHADGARGHGRGRAVDFDSPAGWDEALDKLLADDSWPHHIAFLNAPVGNALPFERGLARVLAFAGALARAGHRHPPPPAPVVHWITRDLLGVEGSLPDPERQTIWGAARVLPQEWPGIDCRVHDLDAADVAGSSASAAIARALLHPPAVRPAFPGFEAWAWRRGVAWRASIETVTGEWPEFSPAASALRRGGHYLVTGGRSGVGRLVATWLSEVFDARVWVTGRRSSAELLDWPAADRAAARLHYIQGDVADGAHWEALEAAVPGGLRGLHGVFHCAGLPGDGLLAVKDPERAAEVCRPKVAGTRALLAHCAGLELDFVVFFSSINVWYGGLGQADYASANAYLDACALRYKGPWRLRSVAWDSWLETGMARRAREPRGGKPMRLELPPGHWLLTEHRIDGAALLPGTALLAQLLAAQAGRGRDLHLAELQWLRPAPALDAGLLLQTCVLQTADGELLEVRDETGVLCQALSPVGDAGTASAWQAGHFLALRTGAGTPEALPAWPRLELGPRWRCGGAVERVGHDGFRLRLHPEALEADLGSWPWHPALVDVAMLPLQLAAGAFAVPQGVGSVWAAASLAGAAWSHAVIRECSASQVRADVAISDADGRLLMWLGDLRFGVIAPGALLDVHEAAVQKATRDEGLNNDAGLALLRRLLEACAAPHVMATMGRHEHLSARLASRTAVPAPLAAEAGTPSPQDRVGALCALVAQRLGYAKVDPASNFFSLGGDSLSGLQLIADARALGLKLSLAALYRARTLAELAAPANPEDSSSPATPRRVGRFELLSPQDRALVPATVEDAFPLTMLQQGLLFYLARFEGAGLYRDWLWADLEGPLDAAVLRGAWADCVRRHAMLRVRIEAVRFSEPLQLIYPETPELMELGDTGGRDVAGWIDASGVRERPAADYAVRLYALKGERGFHLVMQLNDLMLDGWSTTSLMAELLQRYAARLLGTDVSDAPPALGFQDHVANERRAIADVELRAFWTRALEGCDPLHLCPLVADGQPPHITIERRPFPTSGAVDAVAQRFAVAPKIVLLAAYARALALWTGRNEVTLGLETHTRQERPGGTEVLGLHLNTLPLRVRLRRQPLAQYLVEVARAEADLLAHRHLPLGVIQRDWAVPLFDACFNFTAFRRLSELELGPRLALRGYHGEEKTHYPFKLWVDRDALTGHYQLYAAYDVGRLGADAAQRLAALFVDVVQALDAPAQTCVSQLGSLAPHGAAGRPTNGWLR